MKNEASSLILLAELEMSTSNRRLGLRPLSRKMRLRAGANIANMIARTLRCSCGWVVEQEPYDEKGKFLEIIRNIHVTTFPDHTCEIKEW